MSHHPKDAGKECEARSRSRSRSPARSDGSSNHRRRDASITRTSERTNDSYRTDTNTSTHATVASEESKYDPEDDEDDEEWNEDGEDDENGDENGNAIDIDLSTESGAANTARIFNNILRQIGGIGQGAINQNNIQAILAGLADEGVLHQDEDGNLVMTLGDEEDGSEEEEGEGEEEEEENGNEDGDGSSMQEEEDAPEEIKRDAEGIAEYARYTRLDRVHNYPVNILNSLTSFQEKHSVRPTPPSQLAAISAQHIPTQCNRIERFDGRAFCGKFSHGSESASSMYATATQDGLIHLFNTDTWKRYKQIQAREIGWSIVDIDFSTDSRFVIYSSWSNCVHLINTQGEFELHEALDFEPNGSSLQHCCMFGIRFSTNGSREILAGLNGGIAMLYDIERKRKIWSATCHEDDINTVCWLDDSGNLFATGSDDASIRIWDRRLLGNLDDASAAAAPVGRRGYPHAKPVGGFLGHVHGITSVAAMPDGGARYLLSNSKDQSMKLYDLRRQLSPAALDAATNARSNDRHADYRWQRLTRREVTSTAAARSQQSVDTSIVTFTGHAVSQTLIRCDFSPLHSTGCRYAITGSADGCIYVYDILTGEIQERIRGHQSIVRDVAWHEHLIVSASWDHTVRRHALHDEKLSENPPSEPSIARGRFGRRRFQMDEDEE